MRPRILFAALLALAIALMLIWGFRPKQLAEKAPASQATALVGDREKPPPAPPDWPQRSPNANIHSQSPVGGDSPLTDLSNAVQRWSEQVHRPIEFYGKVVDENDKPVEGAGIAFSWTYYHPEGSFATNTLSNGNGRFALKGVVGADLSVYVGKLGYYPVRSRNQDNFSYISLPGDQPFSPNPNDPIVFHLRKRGPGTDLITSQNGVSPKLEVLAPRDGKAVHVDLMERKVSPDGQLEIAQTKPEYLQAKVATEWSFRMAIPDGGFVEDSDEFPFEAPESGYAPAVEFQFTAGQTNWTTSLKKTYYIAFGQPRCYGLLTVETAIGWGGARLQYVANPDGSRYLEPK